MLFGILFAVFLQKIFFQIKDIIPTFIHTFSFYNYIIMLFRIKHMFRLYFLTVDTKPTLHPTYILIPFSFQDGKFMLFAPIQQKSTRFNPRYIITIDNKLQRSYTRLN